MHYIEFILLKKNEIFKIIILYILTHLNNEKNEDKNIKLMYRFIFKITINDENLNDSNIYYNFFFWEIKNFTVLCKKTYFDLLYFV